MVKYMKLEMNIKILENCQPTVAVFGGKNNFVGT